MIDRIYIKELTKELGFKDYRSVVRWCEYNFVGVLSDIGSKKQYVIKVEFDVAKARAAVKYLKKKYGEDNFMEILNSQLDFYSEYRTAVEEKMNKKQKERGGIAPIQKGFNEKRFLNELKKI